jgi:hypothetical protein
MSEASVEHPSAALPFNDPSRRRRLVKIAAWLAGIALLNAVPDTGRRAAKHCS